MHFQGRVRMEERDGRRPDVGSFSLTRLAVEGDARFSDRARFSIDYGASHAEVIVLGRRVWSREAERRSQLEDQKWSLDDAGAGDRRSGVIRPGERDDGDPGQPQDLLRLLEQAREPRLAGRSEYGRVVVMELDPDKAFGDFGQDVDEASLALTVDEDGGPRRALLRVLGHDGDLTVDYRLSAWGKRVSIAAPRDADVDATPGIEEEELARFDDAPLLQPRAIPAGWVLDLAEVVEGDEGDCDGVDLDYIDPTSEETGYLYLHEVPASCGTDPVDAAQPFTAGRYKGTFLVEDGEVTAELVAGATLIQVYTDLSPEDLATVLSELRPLDLAVTPEPLRDLGRVRAGA